MTKVKYNLAKQVMWGIKAAPKTPGVYIFYQNKTPLYIGKASNLKNRLQNYLKASDLKTAALHKEATDLKLLKLRSNIEALIEESKLIKKLKPRYNILWRDDKNYFYVCFSNDKFPRVFLTHQPGMQVRQPRTNGRRRESAKNLINAPIWCGGPFTDGRAIKTVLRLLRRYFSYCTCKPHFRLCLNAQINNCPGYCCKTDAKLQITSESTNDASIKKYRENITKIKNILTGKDKKFIRNLKDPYELLVLEKIWEHQSYLESGIKNMEYSKLNRLLNSKFQILNSVKKVECYDNSHLSGKEAVGAMTVLNKKLNIKNQKYEWIADKSQWRKFKIRGNYTEDDPRMMEEMGSRRLTHPEWPYPDLIIIDGGITQFNAALRALNKLKVESEKVKVISFAKPQQLIYGLAEKPVPLSELPEEFQKLIKVAIQNTHNFATWYHRKTRAGKFVKDSKTG